MIPGFCKYMIKGQVFLDIITKEFVIMRNREIPKGLRDLLPDEMKARRKLDRLTETGQLVVLDPGDRAEKRPKIWSAK